MRSSHSGAVRGALHGLRGLAVLAVGLAAFSGPASAQKLTGAGATFPYPIYSKWFDTYKQKTGVEINYQSIGSGAGIQQVKAGTVDFGASDAALSNAQLKDMPRKVVHIPTVGGAVALAFNLPSVSSLRLTPDVIVDIFMGKITMWNDKRIVAANPGVELAGTPILPVHRSDGSGTTNIFVNYLSSVSSQWKELVGVGTSVSWPSGVGGKGNDGVAGVVKQTAGAIGYVELAYAKHNDLAVAQVKNRQGNFIEPSVQSTTAAVEAATDRLVKDVRTPIVNSAGATAYPISGLTFLIVYQDQKDPAKAKALVDFISWAMGEGQSYADDLLYAKLPEGVIKVNRATLASLTSNGKKLLANAN